MKDGRVTPLPELKRASLERASKFTRATLRAGDLLISKDGTIGRVAIVPPELEGGNITQHLVRASIHALLNREFIAYAIRSQPSQNWLVGEKKGVALQGVNVEDFRRLPLPPELERELTVIEFALPGKEELGAVLGGIMESANIKTMEAETRDKVIDAASGLTTIEAENAFALSVVQCETIDPVIVAKEKAQAVKKNGLLELIETKENLDSIGGLDVLKEWLLKRRHAFSQRAIEYGLPTPKGLLILGIAGTGKSLTAKATAKVFGVPLLKLDAGRIFAGLVGQSESNLRAVIQTAEAIAPCCLWIDEVEKGFSGTKSSNATDGGTSARVFGTFLSWMQDKKSQVFVVATANDVSQLPPEMLRKGRFDELFFVDLPNQAEREAIWEIQIGKHRRIPSEFDVVQLAKATEGLTGSEIENVFIEALYLAFDVGKEPTDLDIARVLTEFVPLSKLMAEQIGSLRQWAKGRARLATSLVLERGLRKIL